MDNRSQALALWARQQVAQLALVQRSREQLPIAQQQPAQAAAEWSVVSGDASFRRYFRLRAGEQSWVAVDAPPERENARHFVALAQALREHDLPTPAILASDFEQGFLLIEDFGDTLLLSVLTADNVEDHYRHAMALLADWQRVQQLPVPLSHYEPARLQTEMALFPEWLLDRHLAAPMTTAEQSHYAEVMQRLLASAAAQPVVLCHRDFHSRNLMLRAGDTRPGLIDFQDAVWGPVTYDLVSLLRDCYIEWPDAQVRRWALQYRDQFYTSHTEQPRVDDATWLRWFDWMGLQRHLKVLGIFARLCHRDGKRGYLKDLPLTLRYCIGVAERYDELAPFARWLQQRVASRLDGNGEALAAGAP